MLKHKEMEQNQSSSLKIEYRSPKSLTPYSRNTKKHDHDQIDLIAGSIHSYGFDQPIVVDKNGVIIKGHGRREAAIRLNLEKVPVVVAEHLDAYQAAAARVADNKIAEKSSWDQEMLRFEIGSLSSQDLNLNGLGFSESELSNLLKDIDLSASDGALLDSGDAPKVAEVSEDYANRSVRQIMFVMDPETFESVMGFFEKKMEELNLETTLDVLLSMIEELKERSSE